MMEESKSPLKSVKPSRGEARGAKAPASKTLKDTQLLRDPTKGPGRTKDSISRARDDHRDSQGTHSTGRMAAGSPQDQGRGKPRRLTGRTSSGERGKGKGGCQQQQQQTDARQPAHDRRAPGWNRNLKGAEGPGAANPAPHEEKALQAKHSIILDLPDDRILALCALGSRAEVGEGSLTSEQQLGLKQAEERLRRDYIHRLVKVRHGHATKMEPRRSSNMSPEYPNFQYLCKLCSVHVENIQGAHKHIKEKRHKKNIMEKQEENELRALPPPSPAQLKAVDTAVQEAARLYGISEEDLQERQTMVTRMEAVIKEHLPECNLRLYGSCLTRFAFKTSDVNIDVTYPSSMTQPEVLIKVLEILKNSSQYVEVESDFHAKVPVVYCKDASSGLMCKVSAGNDVACLTTNHLAALARLEPRLVPLVLAFRYWAKLCHIDCQAEGGIPSYSLSLMVIFFLQQRKEPILPVYLGNWIEGFDVKRVDEYHLTGVKLDIFVGWELRPPSSGEGRGENKGKPEPKAPPRRKSDATEGLTRLTLDLGKGVSLGQLWLELLRFYTLEFALEEHIISIRLRELLPRDVKNWPRRRLAIEDPFALKRNVARSLNSQMVFEYIQERFRGAYRYFACPQSRNREQGQRRAARKRARRRPDPEREASEESEREGKRGKSAEARRHRTTGQEGHKVGGEEEEHDSTERKCRRDEDDDDYVDEEDEDEEGLSAGLADLLLHKREKKAANRRREGREPPSDHGSPSPLNGLLDSDEEEEEDVEEEEEEEEQEEIAPEDLQYVFDKMIFTGGKPPTVVCSICKRDGHLKDECPEDFKKIELMPLPPMSERFREILDGLCRLCYHELSPTPLEQQKREQILGSLERFIRKEYNDKAQLCLFGSSKNGFGFRDSDLDICMTLEGHDTAEKLNCKEIIEGLAKVLKKHTGLRNILPITTAKVPIVKFEHRQSLLEGDISLYNTLAQHNTRMLATYAAIDPRVQYLGYTMKVFAKRCDIGDASRGSLSSYAYILMVLYFLQQRQPPVIPVLQEIYDGREIPQRMVDGWNAYFFDDLDELRRRMPELQQNRESVGELWLGLLRFYTEEFDFKEHVISIRQHSRLTTFEKQWTSKCIAIEDPFDLNHNLGAGVSRKMTNFIMKAFINGRKLFGTPFYPQPGLEPDYFFDSKVLTDGELAPNDRCCRICGKIGHYMKDCPKRRRMKKKENEKDEDVKEEEPRERRCFLCGDMGHVRRDCPENRHLRQRASAGPVPHMVRSMVSSQSIPIPQSGMAQERVGRTRQPSECSDPRQTPPYSPQPTPQFSQASSQAAGSPQSAQSKGPLGPTAAKQSPHGPQVQLPLFPPGFPHSHPGSYHVGLQALGLLQQQHSQQVQQAQAAQAQAGHHPAVSMTSTSWPIHGPVIQGSSSGSSPSPPGLKFPLRPGNPGAASGVAGGGGCVGVGVIGGGGSGGSSGNPSPMNLNDPSIIFAQPAGRPLGMSGSGRDGLPWHNHLNPGALVGNGTLGKSDAGYPGQFGNVSQGSRTWEHGNAPHYTHSPSWPYRMPQNFLSQGNGGFPPGKAFLSQGPVVANQHVHLLQHGRHHNLNFIQQKK
ncbi:terminal uridylyltransferase 4 isoform X2 [Alosa sapidissima]|uniref:terminal uridylyltransferase 4 isoform X2 n=1 Tax=Alosa sapidissima TaxID=34773 RepID=UPI001C0A19C8|nr:terminal uridylyltransferase 4 isoform X2 [Alosa sapidissima]